VKVSGRASARRAIAAQEQRRSAKTAPEYTIRIRAQIAGLEFNLTTHFPLRISARVPNTVINYKIKPNSKASYGRDIYYNN